MAAVSRGNDYVPRYGDDGTYEARYDAWDYEPYTYRSAAPPPKYQPQPQPQLQQPQLSSPYAEPLTSSGYSASRPPHDVTRRAFAPAPASLSRSAFGARGSLSSPSVASNVQQQQQQLPLSREVSSVARYDNSPVRLRGADSLALWQRELALPPAASTPSGVGSAYAERLPAASPSLLPRRTVALLSTSSSILSPPAQEQLAHSRIVIESLRKQVTLKATMLAETRRELGVVKAQAAAAAAGNTSTSTELSLLASSLSSVGSGAVTTAASKTPSSPERMLRASTRREEELAVQLGAANATAARRKVEVDELRAASVQVQERMLREAIALSRESDEERRTLQLEFSQSVASAIDFEAQKQALQQFARAEAGANAARITELRTENQRLHERSAVLESQLRESETAAKERAGALQAALTSAQAQGSQLRGQAQHEVSGLRGLLDEAKSNERRIRAVAEAEKGGAAELVAALQEEVRSAKNRSQAGASTAELRGQKLSKELQDVLADLEATRKEVTEANTQMRLQQHRFEDQKTDFELQLRQKDREIERVQAQAREDASHFELAIETLRQQVGGAQMSASAHAQNAQSRRASSAAPPPLSAVREDEEGAGVAPLRSPTRRNSMTALFSKLGGGR